MYPLVLELDNDQAIESWLLVWVKGISTKAVPEVNQVLDEAKILLYPDVPELVREDAHLSTAVSPQHYDRRPMKIIGVRVANLFSPLHTQSV